MGVLKFFVLVPTLLRGNEWCIGHGIHSHAGARERVVHRLQYAFPRRSAGTSGALATVCIPTPARGNELNP